MTKSQRITLNADWWPAACRTQGWNSGDRELRLRVCSWAVSLENPTQAELLEAIHSDRVPAGMLTSCNDLNNRGDIDRVKACLGMLADNVKRTLEVGQPHYGSARRKRDLIRAHIKCLGLFEARPRAFVAHLIRDMFGAAFGPDVTIRELTDVEGAVSRFTGRPRPSDLDRLLMRLAAVVNAKRNGNLLVGEFKKLQGTAPLTLHEMKLTAGVACSCAICARIKRPLVPAIPGDENWDDFDAETETSENPF